MSQARPSVDARVRLCATGSLLVLLAGAGVVGCRSGPPPTLVERGDAAFAAGEVREADALYVRALAEGDPAPEAALLGRARVALALREPERALRLHAELARAHRAWWQRTARDDYAAALFAAGRARLDARRAGDAVAALRALRSLDPAWPGLDRVLARALSARAAELAMHGRRDDALALYREATEADAAAVAAYVGAAEILIGSGRKQEALALLERARRADPSDGRVRALTMEAMGLY